MELAYSLQHERHLKRLEHVLREICDHHKQIQDHLRESWSKTMGLFVIADELRDTRLTFEKKPEES
jgi:hypothetical protein